MYTAKANGKNRIEVFEPGMHAAALARLALKGDLEHAARAERVLPPVPANRASVGRRGSRVSRRSCAGSHPRRGVVMPTDFIPVAEETGLIVPLGMLGARAGLSPAALLGCARRHARPAR